MFPMFAVTIVGAYRVKEQARVARDSRNPELQTKSYFGSTKRAVAKRP